MIVPVLLILQQKEATNVPPSGEKRIVIDPRPPRASSISPDQERLLIESASGADVADGDGARIASADCASTRSQNSHVKITMAIAIAATIRSLFLRSKTNMASRTKQMRAGLLR
jgi:hypothetical protein